MEEGEREEGEIEEEKGTYNKKDAGTQGARSGIMYSSAPVRYQGFSKFRPSAVPTKEADVDALMRGLTNMVTHDQNSGGLSAKAIAAANAAAAMSSVRPLGGATKSTDIPLQSPPGPNICLTCCARRIRII